MDNRFKFRCWDDIYREMIDLQEQDVNPYNISDIPQNNIMQCTGLKDKAGNLIFEGDIVTIATKYSGNLKGYVYYDLHTLQFKIDIKGYANRDLIYFVDKYGVIIIGNIYQNPELLT